MRWFVWLLGGCFGGRNEVVGSGVIDGLVHTHIQQGRLLCGHKIRTGRGGEEAGGRTPAAAEETSRSPTSASAALYIVLGCICVQAVNQPTHQPTASAALYIVLLGCCLIGWLVMVMVFGLWWLLLWMMRGWLVVVRCALCWTEEGPCSSLVRVAPDKT